MSDTLIVNNILNAFLERKGTDLHLIAGSNPVIRVDGKIVTMTEGQVMNPDTIEGIAGSFLNKEQLEKLYKDKELSTVYSWANRARFRVKFFYQKGYLAISFRLVPPYIRSPKELRIPAAILQLLNRDKGLIIITGPFGSGRTTSAASLVETINQNKGLHIQTLEKPIEYLFVNNQSIIEQREVGTDVNTFTQGLKDMFNEDVDVAYVDQLYEDGMEELVLELAESGKLVILVMDSNSVISSLERFISGLPVEKRFWGQDLLSEVLLGVLSQRLLTRVGGGLTLASEILTVTNAVKGSIKDNSLHQLNSIMQTSRDEGMVILDKSLFELVRVGEVSIDEARREAMDPQSFK